MSPVIIRQNETSYTNIHLADGAIGKQFEKVGGPFAKDGAIGKNFNADGAVGGTVQEEAGGKGSKK